MYATCARNLVAALLVGLCLPTAAGATPAAAVWFGESLLCRATGTSLGCRLWLDPDGRYTVFSDRGGPQPAVADGPVRLPIRTGRYAASATTGGIVLCLRPDPSPTDTPPRDDAPPLFRDRGCLTLPVRPIGEPTRITYAGRTYTLVLIQGR